MCRPLMTAQESLLPADSGFWWFSEGPVCSPSTAVCCLQTGLLSSRCQFNYSSSGAGKTIGQSYVVTVNCEILLLCVLSARYPSSCFVPKQRLQGERVSLQRGVFPVFTNGPLLWFSQETKCDSTTLNPPPSPGENISVSAAFEWFFH